MKRSKALILVLLMLIGLLPQSLLLSKAEATPIIPQKLEGKTISILGDSISTYTGVSNNTTYNTTIGNNAVYYSTGRLGVYQEDTWWQQAIDVLGLRLMVNNSWSGSCIYNTRAGTVGAYVDRSIQLHNAQGEEPDIIAIYLGTNDFCNYKSTLGTSDIDYGSLITETESGYTYAVPSTAAQAYAIMLHKALVQYPNAEVYCFTLLPQKVSTSDVALLEQFNRTILEIAEHFEVYSVDLYHNSGIKNDENYTFYMADNYLHPGPWGMDAITGCFVSSILENSRYVTEEIHSITYNLDNVIVNQGTAYAMMEGTPFSCNLTVPTGYRLEVAVAMGGKDITASCYGEGKISISSVTDDLTITASATLPPKDAEAYRWEFDGNDLVSVNMEENRYNPLTRLAGSITDGVHKGSRFQISENVVLYHDRPWVIQWKSEGNWTDTTDGALLFAGATASSTGDTPYLYRRHKSDFIAFGVRTGSQYYNYGVALGASGIDATIDHVYRIENRIAADGGNMAYLYVDEVEIGPMNHHWIGGTDQKKTVDWLNGRDFVFSYMGTTPHTIGNCSIDYIQVYECVHSYQNAICTGNGIQKQLCKFCGAVNQVLGGHNYTAEVTPPTCVEPGYTTYTCACGDSYVADEVTPIGHSFQNSACSICQLAAVDLSGANVKLESNLAIGYVVKKSVMDLYENVYVKCILNGVETVIRKSTYDPETQKYYFYFKGIAPRSINDTIVSYVYGTRDGVEYCSVAREYSIAQYCYRKLPDFADNVLMRTLLVDLLNYGAAMQIYAGYRTDVLANAKLSDTQKAWGTAIDRELNTVFNAKYAQVEAPKVVWKGASLVLKNSVAIRYKIQLDSSINVAELKMKVKIAAGDETVVSPSGFEKIGDGVYYIYFNRMNAGQMSEAVYSTIYLGDIPVSHTACYSVESYAYTMQTSTVAGVADLVKAMIRYGDSAKAYMNS